MTVAIVIAALVNSKSARAASQGSKTYGKGVLQSAMELRGGGHWTRDIIFSKDGKQLFTSIGSKSNASDDKAEEKIKNLIKNERVIAWGEIGLDFHYDNSPRDVQVAVFRQQLHAARECDLPVVIHTREAEAETIEILQSEYKGAQRRGVFHCFSGSMALAQKAIELGFMISFSGIVTFKKADELREVAKQVPLERLLIETDCPYLTPIPYRGKRNEPAYVVEVARCLAGTRGVEVEEIASVTTENFQTFFGIA